MENNKSLDLSYENLALFVLILLAIICTPFAAKLVSPYFSFAGYGALIDFFTEIFIMVFWAVELIILCIVYKKKYNNFILVNRETKGQLLPGKRVFILSVITIVCILTVSAQIGFSVKPFYDFGDKINGYELMTKSAILGKNACKCVWIVIMVNAAQKFIESIKGKEVKFPIVGIVMMLTLGVYDLIVGANTLPITYEIFYFVFGCIFLLADRSMIKSFLMILFIFLF